MATKVLKFYCVPASARDNQLLCEQVKLGSMYRRDLAWIENRARELRRAIADWPARDVPIEKRSEWWKSDVGRAASKAWHESDECKRLKKSITDGQIQAATAARKKARRFDTAWGTCGLAAEAAEAARVALEKEFGLIDKETGQTTFVNTKFPSDEGRVGVQFQRDTDKIDEETGEVIPAKKPTIYADELIGGSHNFCRIGSARYSLLDRVDGFQPAALDASGAPIDSFGYKSKQPKGKRFHLLQIRVGTVDKRSTAYPFDLDPDKGEPIWAKLHVLLHQKTKRPQTLPHERVKWVFVQRVRCALRYRWSVCFVIEDSVVQKPHEQPNDRVAVDLGWRQLFDESGTPAGIRLLYWMATSPLDLNDPSSPVEGQLVIPQHVVDRKPFSSQLESNRTKNREAMQAMLLAYLQSVSSATWLAKRTAQLASWKKPSKFVLLLNEWRKNRIAGDQAAFAALEAWNKQDAHLYLWSAPNITKMQRQIQGRVDQFAVQLARRYGIVIVENFKLPDVIEKKDLQEQDQDAQKLRKKNARRVNVVAPGRARAALKRFATKYNSHYIEEESAFTTVDCASCGHRREFDLKNARAQLLLACDNCGVVEDQDRTAARNLLAGASAIARGENGWPLEAKVSKASKKKVVLRRTRKRIVV